MQLQKYTLLFILMVSLSACGYHLRGAYALPKGIKAIFVQGGSKELREQLAAILKSSSGSLAKTRDKADAILFISGERLERRVVSLSGRGRSNDIELDGHFDFELRDAKNNIIVEKEPVNFRREYFNDQQDIIAKDNEEIVIRKEMYQQAVKTILSRANTVLNGKSK